MTVAVRGSGLQAILRSFDKSNKGLPTPVSINSKAEITGGSFVRFLFKGSLVICSPGSCCAWSSPRIVRWQGNHGVIFAAAQPNVSEGVSHDIFLLSTEVSDNWFSVSLKDISVIEVLKALHAL